MKQVILLLAFAGLSWGQCGSSGHLILNLLNTPATWDCTTNAGLGTGTVTSVGFTGGLISVASPTTTPALTVAGTSGGVPYFSDATHWASSAAGTIGHIMLWGGAAAAPTDGGAQRPPAITFVFNGGTSVLTTGTNGLYPGNGANTGTINRVDISGGGTAGATCSVTVDIWKANAAIPTSGGKISASAPVTLSTANLAQAMDISTWTKGVAANDVWGANIASVTGCITALVQIWYN